MFRFILNEETEELRIKRLREDVQLKLNAFVLASESLSEAVSRANITLAEIASTYYAERDVLDQSIDYLESEIDINNRLKYYMSELINYR